MQEIERSQWLPYSVESIYTVLTDVEKFAMIVKRLDSITVLERDDIRGKVKAVVDLPGGKIFETEGVVSGNHNKALSFTTQQPFPLEIHWALQSDTHNNEPGTLVNYTIRIDLSPIIGFVPDIVLNGYLSAEMDGDLKRLEAIMQS
jgi:ribosome-associated toxin RatA of RatAB toxin-antitoxin module